MPSPTNNLNAEHCFTAFNSSIDEYSLPERFTFPFYYQPHPLCLLAAKELQQHLNTQTQWQHNFGLGEDKAAVIGKMFGVLLVENEQQQIGYLAAFSGKLANQNNLPKFVPPVFDMLTQESFFLRRQQAINQINTEIEAREHDPARLEITALIVEEKILADTELAKFRAQIIAGRKRRKAQRANAQENRHQTGNETELLSLTLQLAKESVHQKNQLRDLKRHWDQRIEKREQQLNQLNAPLSALKNQRKTLSAALQQKLFAQYRFLNKHQIEKDLNELFQDQTYPTPPAGSGECAAPKLLQYAFKWKMKPLALAEFWWGSAPKSQIRQHQNFYPCCLGKCQPILAHMLKDIPMDDNPLIVNPATEKALQILYQDEVMLVINKPAEFLSVPGKSINDSVYLRIKQQFPKATGPLMVHRLDMSTSGLMVIALTKAAHKALQKQFIRRLVKKRYVALLAGIIAQTEGDIDLPLCGDLTDRPRQIVCEEFGKSAQTHWQLIAQHANQSRVYLYPKTGRTHQLRVHCAHKRGLNIPIVGDDLYGNSADRLHLHAEFLQLTHPLSKTLLQFQVDADF